MPKSLSPILDAVDFIENTQTFPTIFALNTGNRFYCDVGASGSVTFSGGTPAKTFQVLFRSNGGGHALTWLPTIHWDGGAPDFTTVDDTKYMLLVFQAITTIAGSNHYIGAVVAINV